MRGRIPASKAAPRISGLTFEPKEGWGEVYRANKWHYFKEGRALCGRAIKFTYEGLEQGKDNSPDNCAECKKRLLSQRDSGVAYPK